MKKERYSMGFFDIFKKKATPEPIIAEKTYNRRFKIAGVTFDAPDGTSRQETLRKIYYKKPPFEKHLDVALEQNEDTNGIDVIVNGFNVGCLHEKDKAFVLANKERIKAITDFRVNWFNPDEDEDDEDHNDSDNPTKDSVFYGRVKVQIITKNQ